MSRRQFSLLLVVTLVVAAIVLLLPGRTGQESGFTRTPFLPELQQQVNDLEWLRGRGAGDRIIATLVRAEDHWQVEEAHGYRADWERLRALLSDLAQAEIVEAKTRNPDYYDRLGVEDVAAADAGGLRIDFAEGSGLPGVIVGKRAEGRDGRYVRLADRAESALIDRSLDLPEAAADWLEKDIVDIADTEVVQVDIVHPDGERVTARKVSADDEHFELEGVPEDREIRSAWTVDSLANALGSLTLEDVAPQDRVAWDGAVEFALVTADGLRVEAALVAVQPAAAEADGKSAGEGAGADVAAAEHWIRLRAGLYQTALDSAVQAPGDIAGGEAGDDVVQEGQDPAERAAEINRRVEGWAYRIPKYKYDAMSKRLEDLLQAPAEEAS